LESNNDFFKEENHRTIQFKKGETLVKQGSFVTHIIFLTKGIVKMVMEGTNGKNIISSFQISGNFLCLSSIYCNDSFPYTIKAINNATVCMIRKDAIINLQKRNFEIDKMILNWYIQEYNEMYKKLQTYGTKNMPGRLADAILYFSQERFQKESIFSFLSRKDIAEFAAMSLESMMKYLTEFKNDKLISIKGKDLIINNISLLERLSRVS